MRSLLSKPNVEPADSDYPYGYIRDRDGATPGTPVNEEVYGDIHQFFEKLMAESGVVANDLPDNDYNGFQLFEALSRVFVRSDTAELRKKIIEIGDWNMDTTASVDIDHGLPDNRKIRSVKVIIRNDATPGNIHPLEEIDTASEIVSGGVALVSTVFVRLMRVSTGFFKLNPTLFDATSYNRGWITIEYEV